jgi:NAD-reducing hydrogenase small subunit
MGRLKLATVWLGGCSGCHMSFLDLDEFLFDVAAAADVVFSPVGSDTKEYPQAVDVCLIEGAICNVENLEMVHKVRERTKLIISFGDCAVTGNVSSLRNVLPQSVASVLDRAYLHGGDRNPSTPNESGIVPPLLDTVVPVHAVVPVDVYLPGCPPPASRIKEVLVQILEKGTAQLEGQNIKFG